MVRRLLLLAAVLALGVAAVLVAADGPARPDRAPVTSRDKGGRPEPAPARRPGALPDPRRPSASRPSSPRPPRRRSPRPAPREHASRPAPPPRPSYAVGSPSAGRLVGGVRLPAAGTHFFTWDPVRRTKPNRPWRRWATRRMIRTLHRVLAAHAARRPGSPRIGVGDLSRPRGGDFGARYGLPGHASHQSGLDADLYYPRRDGCECAPDVAAQIDRRGSQDLVDLWVAAGARYVFVGPNTGLRGPPGVVQVLAHHDNHLHVRLP